MPCLMTQKTNNAASDTQSPGQPSAPAIILVGTQLGENIGTVARAMLNFGLTDLRLVAPRSGWHIDRAIKASAGAEKLIENRRLFDNLAQASADLGYLVATTARLRDMVKPILTPQSVAQKLRSHAADKNVKTGIVFGPERSGLENEDISLADIICRVPLNPDFSSLNLAQAVLIMGYEWFCAGDTTTDMPPPMPHTRLATRDEMNVMFAHFEAALEAAGFLAPPEKAPAMARNLRNMLHRAELSEQDIRTFRGVINALLRWPRGAQDTTLKKRVAAISQGQRDIISDEDEN